MLAAGIGLWMFMNSVAIGEDASNPLGDPTLEMPTLHSLGVYWIVKGDDNRNAKTDFFYRKAGSSQWRKAPPLFCVDKGAHRRADGKSSVDVPDGAWLFAGSALLLEPETNYDLKLTLTDPDGGSAERFLKQATIGEPVAPKNMRELHVVPGSGGGAGTAADPCKGLKEAIEKANPGTMLLLHKGTYPGPVVINKSGQPGQPIILRAAGDGDSFIDGMCPEPPLKEHVIDVTGMHDVWIEGLSLANAFSGIKAAGAQRIVMRRCHVSNVECGFYCSLNEPRVASGFFISDNVIKGPLEFPLPGAMWHKRLGMGVWVVGTGHVVCYNRITNMEDGVDTGDFGVPVSAIDFHNNEISEMADDGSELDGSERNVRNFLNRYTNTLVCLSFQPVHGGPVYVFRNVGYNFRTEATKLRIHPTGDTSGMILVHNTFVHNGTPWLNGGSGPIRNCFSRNNLFIGTEKEAAYFAPHTLERCDFDYDGFGGFSGPTFLKFLKFYATPEDVKTSGLIEKHHVIVDPKTLFESGIQTPTTNPAFTPEVAQKEAKTWSTLMLNVYQVDKVDLRLKPGTAAIGAGELLPEYGDDLGGKPYLGAYAPGSKLPWYGPRKEQ